MSTTPNQDLARYAQTENVLETSRSALAELEHTEAVELFQKQLALLKKRLLSDPRSLRTTFVADGVHAIAWEFQQEELGADFTKALWELLLRNDDMSLVLMRFIWRMPLKYKRKFVKAIDDHLSDRYPMFKGLSVGWPMDTFIPPYIRAAGGAQPGLRARQHGLSSATWTLGYTAREVELFVWLEAYATSSATTALRAGRAASPASSEPKGGCPVKIHIPEMIELLGTGKFREALELIESCNPLPERHRAGLPAGAAVPGRVHAHQAADRDRPARVVPAASARSWSTRTPQPRGSPASRARGRLPTKPPIAIVGSGPSGLINAYLLAAEGFPVTVFEAFHELGGVLRYGIPEFRLPNELIDDVVDQDQAARRPVRHATSSSARPRPSKSCEDAGFWKIFVGTGAGLPTLHERAR